MKPEMKDFCRFPKILSPTSLKMKRKMIDRINDINVKYILKYQ